jgi:hypothetical protein
MLGYTDAKVAEKAAKRGLSVEEFTKVLVAKRHSRKDRRRAARSDKFEGTRCESVNGKCVCPRD